MLNIKWFRANGVAADALYNIMRSYLKRVFCPNLHVDPSLHPLDILAYASGLKFRSALIWNQNPFFEMASRDSNITHLFIYSPHLAVFARKPVPHSTGPVCYLSKCSNRRALQDMVGRWG